jgi:predicted TIM-barrel fold metal-dependent hydrolase
MIDGHAHACGDLLTPEGIVGVLDANGVDQVVLVPGEHESAKTYALPNLARQFPNAQVGNVTNAMTKVAVRAMRSAKHLEEDNEFVYSLTRDCPGRVIQFFWVLLHAGFDATLAEDRFQAWRFKGLKVHQCWDRFDVLGTAFDALAAFAASHDIPIFIHLDGSSQCAGLIETAARHQDTTFIVGHLYGLEHFVRCGNPLENLYFDFSCPDIVSDVRLKLALDHFGASRLMMGSDSPYGRDGLARSVDRVRALGVSADDEALMLGGNMARLLRLETPHESR